MQYVPTDEMLADCLTKPTAAPTLKKMKVKHQSLDEEFELSAQFELSWLDNELSDVSPSECTNQTNAFINGYFRCYSA